MSSKDAQKYGIVDQVLSTRTELLSNTDSG